MAVRARIRIRHRGCVTEDWTRDGVSTLVRQLASDGVSTLFLVHAETQENLESILDKMEKRLESFGVISKSAGTAVARAICPCAMQEDSVTWAIHSSGCSILYPVVYQDGHEIYDVVAPDNKRIHELLTRLEALGEAAMEKFSKYNPAEGGLTLDIDDLASRLTEKQLDALLRAYGAGYFSIPRRTSSRALARELGISRSTFEEHVRKAEYKLLEYMAGLLARHRRLVKRIRK